MNSEELVLNNKKLVTKVIKDLNCYWNTKEEYEDLYSIGVLGLVKGSKTYNGATKPSTYLYNCIKNELCKEFISNDRLKRKGQVVSLDNILNNDTMQTFEEFIKDDIDIENQIIQEEQSNELYKTLKKLKPKYQKILIENYGLDGNIKTRGNRNTLYDNKSRQNYYIMLKRAKNKLKQEYFKEVGK